MLLKFDPSSIPKAGHILLEAVHRLVAIWILEDADLTFHNLNRFHFRMAHMGCHISVKVFQAVLWIPFCGFLQSKKIIYINVFIYVDLNFESKIQHNTKLGEYNGKKQYPHSALTHFCMGIIFSGRWSGFLPQPKNS